MNRLPLLTVAALLAVGPLVVWTAIGQDRPVTSRPIDPQPDRAVKSVEINLDEAVHIKLPDIRADLQPAALKTPDGKGGWVIQIPGGRPIATPAYADGLLFVGGGYGSHEFYAFDAQSGVLVWRVQTDDDGPTAAVVEEGCVAFNTESCTIYVLEARTGRVLWHKWLGDPLMSQPAIASGRLYMAYPEGPGSPSQGGHPNSGSAPSPASQPGEGGAGVKPGTEPSNTQPDQSTLAPSTDSGSSGHRLLCAALRTGEPLWEREITADVISAPVVEDNRVYVTCFDGTSFCFDAAHGNLIWRHEHQGTSAPLIAHGQVIVTQREQRGAAVVEGIQTISAGSGRAQQPGLKAAGPAEYLQPGKAGAVALGQAQQQALDGGVGFANAPAAAQLNKATANVNVSTVAGGWAYQGARAAMSGGQMFNAQGQYFNSVRTDNGELSWRSQIRGGGLVPGSQAFSPPALGKSNLYLCSASGHLVAVRQADGQVVFAYATGQPIAFQPALARGSLYAGTANGLLICVQTGDPDVDGWYAWGGNARHNQHN